MKNSAVCTSSTQLWKRNMDLGWPCNPDSTCTGTTPRRQRIGSFTTSIWNTSTPLVAPNSVEIFEQGRIMVWKTRAACYWRLTSDFPQISMTQTFHRTCNNLPNPKRDGRQWLLINQHWPGQDGTEVTDTAASSSPSSPREEIRAQIMKELWRYVWENWLSYCNLVIPQQRLALSCSRFAFRKLDFTTRLQWDLLRNTDPQASFATEANLVEALDLIFPRINDDELLKQYAWAGKVYPQYHVTMYVLWHLCVQPEGPNVDRAWQAIERLFSDSMRDDSATRLGSKSSVLAALRAKAMLISKGSKNVM